MQAIYDYSNDLVDLFEAGRDCPAKLASNQMDHTDPALAGLDKLAAENILGKRV